MSRPRARPRHLVLAGMMGAGKTTVGRLTAAALGWPFVDLDEELGRRHAIAAATLLSERGEAAFRRLEARALAALLAADGPRVVALGGGSLASPAARRWVRGGAATLLLEARPETLARRLADCSADRPLLRGRRGSALVATLAALQRARRRQWAACDGRLASDDAAPAALAQRAAAWARQRLPAAVGSLQISAAGGSYPVEIGSFGCRALARRLMVQAPGQRLVVVTCRRVAALWGRALLAALRAAGATAGMVVVPRGSAAKRWAVAGATCERLLAGGWQRGDCLVALGGGAVGDLTGFVASVLLRGGPYLALPTTTLAAIDASVGGKNGVDGAHGKNQMGTIWPPSGVLIDWRMLASEPAAQRASGWVEALKVALALDAGLFFDLEAQAAALRAGRAVPGRALMARALALKAQVVAADEREQGPRAVLNLGHTIGHAIEARGSCGHGQAVAWGLLAEAEMASALGLGPAHLAAQVAGPLAAMKLSTAWRNATIDLAALAHDKKRRGAGLRLPVVSAPGRWRLVDVPLVDVRAFCARHMRASGGGRRRAR